MPPDAVDVEEILDSKLWLKVPHTLLKQTKPRSHPQVLGAEEVVHAATVVVDTGTSRIPQRAIRSRSRSLGSGLLPRR